MTVKERTLEALLAAQGDVSGEWLARKLGVTRNAVWKAITQLRQDGYEIAAVTNRGYRLVPGEEHVGEAEIAGRLTTSCFGRRLELHREIDSTNRRAKELAAAGAPEGTLVVACAQSGGKGRFGRPFFSPEGMGIYFTVILRPQLPADRAVMITSMSAVAVARAIERVADVKAEIKWVNDIYINGRKTCGILHEAAFDFETGRLEYAVCGIGINCNPCVFPEELQGIATSIGNECGQRISRGRLVAEVMNCMEELYGGLSEGSFMPESRQRSCVLGREITVLRGDERYDATAVDIDDEGSLVVALPDGTRRTVHSGEISIRLKK